VKRVGTVLGPPRAHRRRDADRGALSVVCALLVVIVLAAAGLVVDGGRALALRRQAANVAEGAARSAVVDELVPGRIDPGAARARAISFAERSGVDRDAVDVRIVTDPGGATTVVVTVVRRSPAVVLALGGREELTVRATGAARAVWSGGG